MSNDNSTHSHQKYSKLAKSRWGTFGRSELSIMGAPCPDIRLLAERLIEQLPDKYHLAYVDAEHTETDTSELFKTDSTLRGNAGTRFADRQYSACFDRKGKIYDYQRRALFNDRDLVIVNGNHFRTDSQIVVIDNRRSLYGMQDRFTDIQLVILRENIAEIPMEMRQILDENHSIPVYRINETEQIAREVEQFILDKIPPLSGLVLAGGKSRRMHTDKTKLKYHGKPQRRHLYELLDGCCEQIYLSCRQEQLEELPEHFNTITDSFIGMGPMGGLLSAFRQNPHTAWLVVACDLPLLSRKSLQHLIENRNPSKMATAFINRESSFPEPLVTIWEPKSYPVILHFLSIGYPSPKKVLINSEIELLDAPDPRELTNVNRPEEYRKTLETLTAN